jgi:hypothetical protein
MRTTLSIDNDVLSVARDLAKAQRGSVGAVISDMARRGLTQAAAPGAVAGPPGSSEDLDAWLAARGFALFGDGAGGRLVTDEEIDRIRDEIGA